MIERIKMATDKFNVKYIKTLQRRIKELEKVRDVLSDSLSNYMCNYDEPSTGATRAMNMARKSRENDEKLETKN